MKADIDNGYTRIANEIMERLCAITMSSSESRVLFAVISKTFRWNKSTDWISNVQIASLTGMEKAQISKARKRLIERKILIKLGREIGVNTQLSEWVTVSNSQEKVVRTDNKSCQNGQLIDEKSCQNRQQKLSEQTTNDVNSDNKENGLELEKVVRTDNKGCQNRQQKVVKTDNHIRNYKETNTKDNNIIKKKPPDKKKSSKKKPDDEIDLSVIPEHLPKDKIIEFVEFRKEKFRREKKNLFTQHGLKSLVNKLTKFQDQGYDVSEIMDESISQGWAGVFEPKNNLISTGANHASSQQDYRSQQREIDAAIDDITDTSWADDD